MEDDEYVVPRGVFACYFNMSSVISDQELSDGSHDGSHVLHGAAALERHKLLVLRCVHIINFEFFC